MAQAIIARRDGDTFQARVFWGIAVRLLDEECPIVKVGFEKGPKSFDDIYVEYDNTGRPSDQFGVTLRREYLQCKWHSTPGSYGYRQLCDPEFINAKTCSFLERARQAQKCFAPDGSGIRFKLVTNWRPQLGDPLHDMIRTRSGALRLNQLFGSKTDNSKFGAVRKAWRQHLDIDENELRILTRTLAFNQVPDTLDNLRERLDLNFKAMGLKRVPINETSFFYDELIFQWMSQERHEFDRASFKAACDQEGILEKSMPASKSNVYGVKTIQHPFDYLENRCEDVLDLVDEFDERYIRSDADWVRKLYPDLKEFLTAAAKEISRLKLVLDVHVSLAFAAGSVLNIKCGRAIEIEQRVSDKFVWSADDMPPDPEWSNLNFEVIEIDVSRPELAIAVGLTHDITADVTTYVSQSLPKVGRILHCVPSAGSSSRSVVCGRHAFDLSEALTKKVNRLRDGGTRMFNHLFIAAPNIFTFFLGQHQVALGPTKLYEFDFDGNWDGSYRPSLTLPIGHVSNIVPQT